MSIQQDVWEHLRTDIPQGGLFTARHLRHVAGRVNVARELGWLARLGFLERVAPGTYYRPFDLDDGQPDPAVVARFRMETRGETVGVHGADAARRFGLDAPPATDPRFHTSARSRTVTVTTLAGTTTARFRHVPGVYLSHPGTPAGDALAALHYLGRTRVRLDAVTRIHAQLPPADRQRIRDLLHALPDDVVSAWLGADGGRVVGAPAAASPVGRRRVRPFERVAPPPPRT